MKRNLFTLVLVLLLVVAAIGFVRGWFVVSRPEPPAGSHKVNINLAVDPDKVKADAEAVKDKTAELTGQATEGAKELGQKAKDSP